eukprot:1262786-Pleurochrysis_carterae.AAC.1
MKQRATFGCHPRQKPAIPPCAHTFRATLPIARDSPLAVCICVLTTSVGFIARILTPPAVPPASTLW